jgi:hypothetical protein
VPGGTTGYLALRWERTALEDNSISPMQSAGPGLDSDSPVEAEAPIVLRPLVWSQMGATFPKKKIIIIKLPGL